MTEETKAVQNQIIRVGTMTDGTHSHTEELPFETEVVVNPDLKKGEWRYKTVDGVEQKGKLGSRTTEWTIKNSEVQAEPKATEDRPFNAIIEVGSSDFEGEVKHTEHFEIPFEVEVRYNNQLPTGTSNEIQKGVKGSYDVEYKQVIKNGEANGEMTKTEANRVEAKKHIIEVGTKVEAPEKNYSKDVDVEIEYVYDDTKDKGVVETGELTPGKVETKVVDKYNPETGKVEQTTEEVVTKTKQKVIVGTKDFTGKYEYKKTCPIPFEVEPIEDATLAKGTKIIDQEGKPGSKTTSYEQAIKNGHPDGEAKVIRKKRTEPTKHFVRVGTKPLEETRENFVDKAISYETKVIYDENLEAGNRLVDNEGKDGKERVTTTITSRDGDIEYNSEGKVLTPKEDRIVRVGVKPVVKEEAIPFNTSYTHNPELKAGEVKKTSDGTPGTVTITTTFNKETSKLETKVERTEPTNAKHEYGSKTTGEVKVQSEIPYEVEIIEDDTMDAGTHKVVQEGKVGEKETTIVIENSVEESRSDKYTKEAVKKIIKVGTKSNDKMCPIPVEPENPEVPNEPGKPGEDSKDPDKPGEKDFEGPSIPGEDKSNEPGKLGEDLKDPGDPTKPNKQDSKDPSESGSNKPSSNNPTEKSNTSSADSATQVDKAGVLPETGETSATLTFGAAALSFLSGLRLVATKGRKEEE